MPIIELILLLMQTTWAALNQTNKVSNTQTRKVHVATNVHTGIVVPHLASFPPTRSTTLANKIRVVSEDGFGQTATVGVWIAAGSVYETDKNNGVAHFLEHMAFKGTQSRSQQDIELEVENMGGSLNAYTSREQTVYVGKCFKTDVPKMVDILSDILQHSTLSKEHVERERGVILKEKEVVESEVEEVVFDYLHAAAYQGTPLARTILGETHNIKSLQREDLAQYIQTHYRGPRMVVAGAGAVQHSQLVDLAAKSFSKIPDSDATPQLGPMSFTGSEIRVRDNTVDKAHVAIAFEGVSWTHPEYFTFLVLQALIGSWDRSLGAGKTLSARLAETVAHEGLAHSYTSFNTCYNQSGLFGVYFTAEPGNLEDMSYEVINEVQRLGKGISDLELERAKNKVKAAFLMQLDGSGAICEELGRQALTFGRRVTPKEIFDRIDLISHSDVTRVVDKHFFDQDIAVAAVGNLAELPDYNVLRGWTYWNRL
jgi:processing peptidase subunit beta